MAVEDELGLIYFATNEGLLIFDGLSWRQLNLPNRSRINHIEAAEPGRLFVSATGEFGQLVLSPEGDIEYQSFNGLLPESERDFQQIVHCYARNDRRFFITRDRIFSVGEDEVLVINCAPMGGVRSDDNLFIIQQNLPGFFSLHPDGLKPVPGSESLGTINTLSRIGEADILLDSDKGSFFFKPNNEELQRTKFRAADGALVQMITKTEHDLFIRLRSDLYALASAGQPLKLIDNLGQQIAEIGKKNGLLSNDIQHVLLDRFGNLWISQNSGISYVELSSPLSRFSSERGLEGLITAAIVLQNTVYASNFYGIHFKTPEMSRFQHIEGTQAPCFSFLHSRDGRLFASDGPRLLQITGQTTRELFRAEEFIFTIAETPTHPDIIYLGLSNGLVSVRIPAFANKAQLEDVIDEISQAVRLIQCDSRGDFWLALEYQGLSKLTFPKEAGAKPVLRHLTGPPPFEKAEDVFIAMHQNNLYASNSRGYFRLEKLDGPPFMFRPQQFGKWPLTGQPPKLLHDPAYSFFWIHDDQRLRQIGFDSNGQVQIHQRQFAKINSAAIESVFTDSGGISWICTNNGLYRFNPHKIKNYAESFNTLIRRVISDEGTVLFAGTPPSLPADRREISQNIVLPYRNNSLRFEFSALFFEHAQQNQYQYQLEGFSPEWSPWSSNTHKEYTNLPHGEYRFQVRARNIFGTISASDSISLYIKTPWFFSVWAFTLYLILAAGLIRLSLYIYTRRLIRQQRVLEKAVTARTREVEEQKSQIAEKNLILNELATKDDLTGIANHRRIMEYYRSEWQRALREKTSIGILLADVDNFKEFNDSFGHIKGDKCLKKVAQAFTSCALRPADMAGRYGGEEFLMILPQTSPEGILKVAENIRLAVKNLGIPQKQGMNSAVVTISIGVVSAVPKSEMNPQLLLILADQALYRSKGQGKDQVTLAEQYTEV